MNTIRTLIIAVALAGSAQAEAQPIPTPYTLQRDADIPGSTTKQQQDEVMRLMGAYLGSGLRKTATAIRTSK